MRLVEDHGARGCWTRLLLGIVLAAATGCASSSTALPDLGDASAVVDFRQPADATARDLAERVDLTPADLALDLSPSPDGGVALGEPCGMSANGADCAPGLVCCYPCGQPGCMWRCQTPCQGPGCVNGCMLIP